MAVPPHFLLSHLLSLYSLWLFPLTSSFHTSYLFTLCGCSPSLPPFTPPISLLSVAVSPHFLLSHLSLYSLWLFPLTSSFHTSYLFTLCGCSPSLPPFTPPISLLSVAVPPHSLLSHLLSLYSLWLFPLTSSFHSLSYSVAVLPPFTLSPPSIPGVVTLMREHKVCSDGDILTPEQARLLVSVHSLTLGAHAQEGYCSWVCVSVCLCVCLLSHISLLERLFVLKILSCTQRATEVKICGVFFETAPFKSYGVKHKLKSQYAN